MAINLNPERKRLLEVASIPATLWLPAESLLILPSALGAAYVDTVDSNGLRPLSEQRTAEDSPAGGLSQEATNKHFAQAFDGSCARVQLALLDPKSHALAATNNFIKSLAGNTLLVVDAPCGAGAAFLSFLCTVAVLRAEGALPRMPLEVRLVGGEIAGPARNYASSMLNRVQTSLEEQAIHVDAVLDPWDVTCELSNTDLIQRIIGVQAGCGKRLLVVANFSSFLQRDGRRNDAKPQLAELFRHLSGENTLAVWIEPQMNIATDSGGLLPWLKRLATQAWKRFVRPSDTGSELSPIPVSDANFRLPLTPSESARVGLAVVPLDLIRTP